MPSYRNKSDCHFLLFGLVFLLSTIIFILSKKETEIERDLIIQVKTQDIRLENIFIKYTSRLGPWKID